MKKLLTFMITAVMFASGVFALPGFKSFIPDNNGEFIYYKDNSFSRESYIGILAYGPDTYQARYFAPQTDNEPEKIVATLFSIDPTADHFEMTGENVIVCDYTNADDVDIVNYIHDLMYEFSARRIKLGDLTPATEGYKNNVSIIENGLSVVADYPQFGGNVTITYDCMIPFFNLKRITDSKGSVIFECVELGAISSNEDTLFDRFVKVPEVGKVKINSVKPKKADKYDVHSNGQSIVLDKSWEPTMENMWAQSDDAIITIASINAEAPDSYYVNYSLIKMLLQSKDNYHINLSKCDVIFGKDGLRIYSENYMPSNSKVFYGVKYLTGNNKKTYDYLSFATTKANYLLKRSYYDKILKSYSNN